MRALLCSLMVFASAANANFQSDMMKGKTAKKSDEANVQWTLADWLGEKKKIRLMDQWLALHHSSHWEDVILSGSAQQFTLKTDNGTGTWTSTTQTAQTYEADIYLEFIDLRGEYQKTNNSMESYGGAGGLRLLGATAQTTSLTARYGWRRLSNLGTQERWEDQYVEGSLQLYVFREFGLTGSYRYYFPATSNLGNRLNGTRTTAGAFLESGFIRLFSEYFWEPMQVSNSGTVTKQNSEGLLGGVKLIF